MSRRYICSECGKRCTTARELQWHKKTDHNHALDEYVEGSQ